MHVLITGSTGGIGEALALQYANKENVLTLFARDENKLAHLAASCRQQGAKVNCIISDINAIDTYQFALQKTVETLAVDLVIANAGVSYCLDANKKEEACDEIEAMINVNLKGAILTVATLIPFMRQRECGQIALMSSLAGMVGMPVSPTYSATKAGLKAYGEALRSSLCRDGIKVSVVFPGFVESAMSQRYPASKPFLMPAKKAAKLIKKGLKKNKARIAFPMPLALGTKFLSLLPGPLSFFILKRFAL